MSDKHQNIKFRNSGKIKHMPVGLKLKGFTIWNSFSSVICADPESFVGGGPTQHFKLMRRREDPYTTKIGTSSTRKRKYHLNGFSLAG